MRREDEWVASAPDLDAYARFACTQSIHHKPVFVPGIFTPPLRAPAVSIPGVPPILIPGIPGKPQTLNPKPYTLHPTPYILHSKP